ncbi:hypothetical protein QNH47_12055 [Virgibacillus halodenitrificans]|uniref:hypothetical protein n=1 Tax=Virgibacillus halodenitrificans TaxID=1482 RepID=UPI0024BFC93F|nr:hypothetical protein [Virgibacillus halodenitrificans]WHX24917.1 hypothetical protein QNH47_12055 [Virgibacillus halodenitrificans]
MEILFKSGDVYDNPVDFVRIPASHGPNVNYLVCFGTVNWRGNVQTAVYVLMEYDGVPNTKVPPHITTYKNEDGRTDLDNVLEQINLLKKMYEL